MKARGIIMIDYDFPKGYRQAADAEDRLKEAAEMLTSGDPTVVDSDVDVRERRGDAKLDIKRMKIRIS
tara:strand:+ start:1369 stop:1572 length:204 start_codon:yes stop_codon:yes gene_type:complete